MRLRLVALAAALPLLLAPMACTDTGDEGTGDPAADEDTEALVAPHVDGRAFQIESTDQPFNFLQSVVALAALGEDVEPVLEDIDYGRNAGVWAEYITWDHLAGDDGMNSATAAAALAIVHRNTGNTFLTDDQVAEIEDYLDWAAEQDGYIDTHVTAAGLAVAATLLEAEPDRFRSAEGLDFLLTPDQLCSPQQWQEQPWEVAAQFLITGTEDCTPEALSANWDQIARYTLEREAEESEMLDEDSSYELVGLLDVVYDQRADDLADDAEATFAAVASGFVSTFGADPWKWQWGYYKFQFDYGTSAQEAELTEAAVAVLSHFAARGVPAVTEVEAS
jgi:hypothetical protein